ncbi:MAG TPA: von Willebrand factor type A domain-containing protein, partial [Chitinophagales bacterium]|nr:von Willebrand factor type A domain-containing protein [Chitinophagales bacterium]
MRKLLFTSKLILWMLLLMAFAQNEGTGILRGRVYDAATKEAIPFANIVLEMNGQQKGFGETDDSGIYTIQPIPSGIYDLKVSYLGYKPVLMKGVMITADKITYKDFAMNSALETLKDVVVTSFRMVEADKTSSGSTITRDEISHVSSKKSKYASLSVGVKNDVTSISGARDYSTVYYIDGVAVQNNFSPDLGNEEYKSPNENKFIKVMNEPLSTFSIDVDKASYSNVRRFITDGTLPPSEAVRIEEMINYFDYDYPDPAGEDPFSINTEISECPWNNGHQLIHIGLQGKKIEWDQVPPNNLVFLIDVSGSMTATDKLPLLKWCFRLLVEQLREEDRVAIVVYAGNAGEVLSSTSGNKKEKILQAIDDLEAGGSTAGGAGIDLAYKIAKENFRANGNNRVILATDGDFNVGVSSDDELQKLIEGKRSEGIFLTVLGFGTGNYKDSKMEMLADKGNGNYAYVDNILEGQKIFVKELGATLFTIAKDVKLQVEFNPAKVKAYRLIGYENRMLNKEDFNGGKKDAGELG